MRWGQTLSRAGWHTAAGAVVTVGSGIAVNLATSGDYSPWVWVAVAVSTLAVFGVSLWAQHTQAGSNSSTPNGDFRVRSARSKKNLRFTRVRPRGDFEIGRARSGEDLEFRDIEPGHGGGGASHP